MATHPHRLQPTTAGCGTNAKGVTLLYAQVLPVMAIVSLFPAIPKLMHEFGNLQHAAILVPMIVTIPSLLVALTAPFAGAIADRFGRRNSFRAGMILYVLAGLVPVFTSHILTIILSRVLLGIAEAFVVTISSTLIGDYFREERHRWVSWVGITTSIAGTLMIAAGGFLAEISWRGPFFIYTLSIPALILTLIFIDEPLKEEKSGNFTSRAAYPWKQAGIIAAVTLSASLIYYVAPLHIAAVFQQVGVTSPATAGLLQAFTTVAYVLGAIWYRKLHAWNIGTLLALAGVLMGIGQLLMGWSVTAASVVFGALFQQLGSGMVIPSLLAWGQALLPLEQRGRGMGIWATAFFTGTFLCPPLVTAISTQSGGVMAAMVVMGIVAFVFSAVAMASGHPYKLRYAIRK